MHLEKNSFYELCRDKGIALSLLFLMMTGASFWLLTGDLVGISHLDTVSGAEGILDTRFGYTEAEAEQHFQDLGAPGREHVLRAIIPLDILFAVSYTAAMIFITSSMLFIRRPKDQGYPSRIRFVLALPLSAGIADLAENIIQGMILLEYPGYPPGLVSLLTVLTPTKFVLFGAAAAGMLAEITAALLRPSPHAKVNNQKR